MRTPLRLLAVLAVTACAPAAPPAPPTAQSAEDAALPAPTDGLVVAADVHLRPGTWHVADADGDGVLRVRGAGAVLDLTGVTLVAHAADDARDPDAFAGIAVLVEDAPGAVVRGGTLRGFRVGVAVRNSPGAVVEDVDASGNFRQRLRSTVAREDLADWLRPHDDDANEWETRYGAAFSVLASPRAVVRRCRARDGQNGVLLSRSDGAQVYDGDFSLNSGWGVALHRTCEATICRNRMDRCVRGYSHGVYDRGQDSAGILVFEQSSRNVIALNSATHGGDGLFLYAGEESLHTTGTGGCNDNLVFGNDFSHAVANAIEATFSRGNRFVQNRLDDSRHGVWAGYSHDTLVAENSIRGCDSGVSIEHGVHDMLEWNEIEDCGTGVHLWWDEDAELAATVWGRAHELRSVRNRIGPWNRFRGNRVDVLLEDDRDGAIVACTFAGDAPRIRLRGNCAGLLLEGNTFPDAVGTIDAGHTARVRLRTGDGPLDAPRVEGDGRVEFERVRVEGMVRHAPDPDALPRPETLPGAADPFLPEGAPRGRATIRVDEWGPVDPGARRVFPAHFDACGSAELSVLGPDGTFRVVAVSEGCVAEPREGALPGVVRVRAADADGPALRDVHVTLDVGGTRFEASGTLFVAAWDLRFFALAGDPREDAAGFATLLASEPAARRTVTALDFAWRTAAPDPAVGADRFATLATTDVALPAGRYRLATVSDDGLRVWVDGRLVVDDWTQHGPTPHDAVLDLAAGTHALRVEHFELDGWAALTVGLTRE